MALSIMGHGPQLLGQNIHDDQIIRATSDDPGMVKPIGMQGVDDARVLRRGFRVNGDAIRACILSNGRYGRGSNIDRHHRTVEQPRGNNG
jgi:hypothetical protein